MEVLKEVSYLLYRQNGGSGMNLTYNDVMGFEWPEIKFWSERLCEFREEEAAAIKRSQGG